MKYAYSTTGSVVPTNWATVTGVYTNSGCTIPASNGSTGTLYAEIIALNFGQDSGTQNTVRLSTSDMAGNNGTQTSAFIIEIDTISPSSFVLYSPTSYTNSPAPTVIISVNAGAAGTSGINNQIAQFAYDTNANIDPTNWAPVNGVYNDPACTSPAANGTTGTVYVKVVGVPFYQDSNVSNYIRIEIADMAGNLGVQSPGSDILIYNISAQIINVYLYGGASWATNQTPSVICDFVMATVGVNLTTAQFAYSISDALNPTNWASVTGVYADAGCTISATSNETGLLYMKIYNVAFNQDSAILNTIRFRVNDTAGNLALQANATTIPTDSIAPTNFILFSPTTWINTQIPQCDNFL